MADMKLSQSELARRVGISQASIYNLVSGKGYGSAHLHKIARELETTPAYLTGETDDPDKNAPAPRPEPVIHHVTMQVALPTENALAEMFEGLLLAIDRTQSVDEVARELAQLLPTGLSRMQGPLLELPRPPRRQKIPYVPPSDALAPAIAEQEHQQ